MEIKPHFLQKYLHDIAIDQIAEEYKQQGYRVSREVRIGKYCADLIAIKGKETIVVEIKTGKMSPKKRKAIAGLSDYVQRQGGYKFLLAVATPPREKYIDILGINLLFGAFMIDNFPDELDQLSTHTRIEEVSDIDIDEIVIDDGLLKIKGDGVVSVSLQYGSDSDQDRDMGCTSQDSFPFSFKATLRFDGAGELIIDEVASIEVDNSSFYE
ncbi:hypothetical protein ACFL57_01205 [Candidatus Margulisiibacteriota bacterium]